MDDGAFLLIAGNYFRRKSFIIAVLMGSKYTFENDTPQKLAGPIHNYDIILRLVMGEI